MAKFFYRMQNILDIKYKLEESARQEYAEARRRLTIEEEKLEALKVRLRGYIADYQSAINGKLDFLEIAECANSIDIMEEMILLQEEEVKKKSKELEKARIALNQVMQERKMHEKLKEKKFDEFVIELNSQETKEIDEVVSYQYNEGNADAEE